MEINSDSVKIVSQIYMRKRPDQLWYWDYIRGINKEEGDKVYNALESFIKLHSGEISWHFDNELFLYTSIYNNFVEYYENKKFRHLKFPDIENLYKEVRNYCDNNGIIWDFSTTFIEHMYHPWEKVHTPRPPGYKILSPNFYSHPPDIS